MLLTLVRDNGSALPADIGGDGDGLSIRFPETQAGSRPKAFTVEVPYTPQGASLLAHVLLSWRTARPGRSVYLFLPDEPELEIGQLSASRIEWMLPVVTRIAIFEKRVIVADPDIDSSG
jgi:hypothetical protein